MVGVIVARGRDCRSRAAWVGLDLHGDGVGEDLSLMLELGKGAVPAGLGEDGMEDDVGLRAVAEEHVFGLGDELGAIVRMSGVLARGSCLFCGRAEGEGMGVDVMLEVGRDDDEA